RHRGRPTQGHRRTGHARPGENAPRRHARFPSVLRLTARAQALPPISDQLSTLSDRGLRRLLGARTFLRGLEYFRRRAVEDITVHDSTASGTVRATDSEPFAVAVELTSAGIKSKCSCPAFAKGGQHCKHVAALLISVRDQARAQQPRHDPPMTSSLPQTAHA